MNDEALVKIASDMDESGRDICHVLINRAEIPAPLVYDLAGNLKVLSHKLEQIAGHMARGLPPSLEVYAVYDLNEDGRSPEESAAMAVAELEQIEVLYRSAGQRLERVQRAINLQGHHGLKSEQDEDGEDRG